MSKRDWNVYFEDMLESMNKIENYIKNFSYEDFIKDSKTVDAVVRNLEIIGEDARQVDENIKKKIDDIPWKELIGLRNKIIHGYFVIDYEIIWQIIKEDLPELKQKIEKFLKK